MGQNLGGSQTQSSLALSLWNQGMSLPQHTNAFTKQETPPALGVQSFTEVLVHHWPHGREISSPSPFPDP